MKKNPLNDDDYDGNDEQIDDLKELVREMRGALEGLFEHCTMVHRYWGENSNSKEADAAQAAALAVIEKATEGGQ